MKRLAERLLLLFAAFVCLAAAAPLLHADSNVRIVRLSYVDGNVEIDQRDGQGFETAFMNMPVTPGTRIQTRSDSRAEIELEDGSTLRLAPDTLVEFTAMSLRSDGSRDTMVELEGGTAYIDLRHQRDDDFRLNVAHNTMTLHHSVRFRVSLDDRNVTIVPIKGDLEVLTENGKTVDVRKGETLSLDLTDPDHFYRAHESQPGEFDAWDQERQDYRENYANNAQQVVANGYDSAPGYAYGASDMNYYGAYSYLPGYGWVWQPTYMPLGWNPYMDGAWVFYPGYGWQWVSAYPWGWVPYHYGNWFYVSGRGWCWRRHHHRDNDHDRDDWHPAPVIVNGPPHFQPPVPPPTTGPPSRTKPGPNPGPIPPVTKNPRVVIVGRGGGTIYPPGQAPPVRGRLDQNDERIVGPPATSLPPSASLPPAVTPGVVGKNPPATSGTIPVTRTDNGESFRSRPVPPVTPPSTTIATPPSTTVAPPPSRGRYLGPPQTNENPPSPPVRYVPPTPAPSIAPPSPPAPRYVPPTPAPAPSVTPPSPPAPRYVPPTPAPRYNPPPSPPPRPSTPPSGGSTPVSHPSSSPPSHNTGSGSEHHDHPR